MTDKNDLIKDEEDLIKQAKQIRKRLADMRVQNGFSPYNPMPNAVHLNGEFSPYFWAVDLVLVTELLGYPTFLPQPKKKFKK